mmetsp:Transcript_7649/g.8789  ORF Transcript_7649/g.8789 Transcript_7649/m.8789 type:complete len:85 (-) Transcript_7649:59-313(-)
MYFRKTCSAVPDVLRRNRPFRRAISAVESIFQMIAMQLHKLTLANQISCPKRHIYDFHKRFYAADISVVHVLVRNMQSLPLKGT